MAAVLGAERRLAFELFGEPPLPLQPQFFEIVWAHPDQLVVTVRFHKLVKTSFCDLIGENMSIDLIFQTFVT